jgi:hypothetical protein
VALTASVFAQQDHSALAKKVRLLGANYGITLGISMKIAISVDDALSQQAEETAKLMGLSRSRLFTLAAYSVNLVVVSAFSGSRRPAELESFLPLTVHPSLPQALGFRNTLWPASISGKGSG